MHQPLASGEQRHAAATHVWLIANPVGGGGKTPGLVSPLLGLLAKRFSDFNPLFVDGKYVLADTVTGSSGEARGETCRARFTGGVGDGIRLAMTAAREIATLPQSQLARCFVIPVGGDGTLSEVIHGLSTVIIKEMGLTHAFLPNIIYLAAGTGADFARLGHCCRSPEDVMDILGAAYFTRDLTEDRAEGDAACGLRRVDVGCVTHLATGAFHYFINEASVGLSTAVVRCVESFKKKWFACLGGTAVFLFAGAHELLRMKPHRFRMRKLPSLASGNSSVDSSRDAPISPVVAGAAHVVIPSDTLQAKDTMEPASAEIQKKDWDQGDWVYLDSTALVFGNGQYFGGGMRICPHGDPCDQALSIASWGETACGFACDVPGIYNGNATTRWKTSRMFTGARALVEYVPPREASAPTSTSPSGVDASIPAHAYMEADGEAIGSLPAIIEISHQINFLLPPPKTKGSQKRK